MKIKRPLVILAVILLVASNIRIPFTNADLATTPIKKGLLIYGVVSLTDSEVDFVASHFDYVDASFYLGTAAIAALRAHNPDIVIIGYRDFSGYPPGGDDWAEVNSHEEWFLHDASANRINESTYGQMLMDFNSTGWLNFTVTWINAQMSNFDGVFIDNVGDSLPAWAYSNWNATPTADLISQYHANMIKAMQYCRANITAGKIIVINTWEHDTQDFLNVLGSSDGKMEEWYGSLYSSAYGFYGGNAAHILAATSRDSGTNKIMWCLSYTHEVNSTFPDTVKFDYCAFLLALKDGTKTLFAANDWDATDGQRGYYPIMDTALGSSNNDYYYAQNVFMRDFTGGLVILNPAASSYPLILGDTYQFPNGTTVSNFTIAAQTGEILLTYTPEEGEPEPEPVEETSSNYNPGLHVQGGNDPIAEGSNFNIYLTNGSGLAFQNDLVNKTFTIEVLSGTLNGTTGTLGMTQRGGTLTFHSNEAAQIQVSHSNEYALKFDYEGATFSALTPGHSWNGTVPADTDVYLHWGFIFLMPLEENFMLYVGIAGLGLMVSGVLLLAYSFRTYPLFSFKKEMVWEKPIVLYSGIATFLGFGLVITWLLS